MNHHVKRIFAASALAVLLIGGRPVFAADPPAPLPGEDVFKDKTLVVAGNRLVLPVEAEMKEQVKQLKISRAKAQAEADKRKAVDKEVADTKQLIKDMDTEYAKDNDMLSTVADPAKQNQIIGRTNSIASQLKTKQSDLEALIEKQKELSAAKEAFIEQIADVGKNIDAEEHAYDEVSKDSDVAAAVTQYNQAAKLKVKLGPTSDYLEDIRFVKKALTEVQTEVVTVSTDHGVPEVDVVLNGKTKQAMVWDSGASSVVISTELAASLGMHPGAKDPLVHAKLADGHVVVCHQMTIKSVQVGAFTVNDVECMVMPPDIKDADPLLGDSFQSHFLSKLDQGGGTLRLTPVDSTSAKHTGAKATPH